MELEKSYGFFTLEKSMVLRGFTATLKSVCGPQVRIPILVGFVEEQGRAAEILENHWVHEYTEYREEPELTWLGTGSRWEVWADLVPPGSLPCFEVVPSGPLKSSDYCKLSLRLNFEFSTCELGYF